MGQILDSAKKEKSTIFQNTRRPMLFLVRKPRNKDFAGQKYQGKLCSVFLEKRISLDWNNPFEEGKLDFIVQTFKHQSILETQFYKSLPTNSVSTSFFP